MISSLAQFPLFEIKGFIVINVNYKNGEDPTTELEFLGIVPHQEDGNEDIGGQA